MKLTKDTDIRALTAEELKTLFPRFGGSIRMAVFNVHDSDVKSARRTLIKEFGPDAYSGGVEPFKKTGIMEIFHHPPSPILMRFAVLCALSVERRLKRAKGDQ